MWKQILDTEYFLLYNSDYEIYVTDYVGIWFCNFSSKSFLSCMKESNDGLEMEDKNFVIKGRSLLTHLECLKNARIKLDGQILIITLSTSFGYPFRVNMRLTEGSKELFFQNVTLSLLKAVTDLKSSERELRDLLLRKDKELAEYKDEKGHIVFRSLKTEPFAEELHIQKHKTYNNNFGDTEFPACVLEKAVIVPKIEENEISIEEPSSIFGDQLSNNPNTIKTETGVKPELLGVTKTEDLKTEIENSMHHRVAASPSKRQRRKLNL